MQTYKLRSESPVDVDRLIRFMDLQVSFGYGVVFNVLATNNVEHPGIPGTLELEIQTNLELKHLLHMIACIPDGHVMYQTVQTSEKYDGERDWSREAPMHFTPSK